MVEEWELGGGVVVRRKVKSKNGVLHVALHRHKRHRGLIGAGIILPLTLNQPYEDIPFTHSADI